MYNEFSEPKLHEDADWLIGVLGHRQPNNDGGPKGTERISNAIEWTLLTLDYLHPCVATSLFQVCRGGGGGGGGGGISVVFHDSACWHMQSGMGNVYRDASAFLSAMPFISLWRRTSRMLRLNLSHLQSDTMNAEI